MGGIVSKKSPDENNESVENSEGKDESLQEYDGDDPFNDNERLNTGDSHNIDSTHNNNNNDDDDDGDITSKQRGGFFNFFAKEELKDPIVPYMGPSIGYYKILDRTKKAKLTFRRLSDAVELDTVDSIMVAKSIPTSQETQRITVPKDVVVQIERKKTKRAIKASTDNNNTEIQKVLYWKKLVIDMMNSNFHDIKERPQQNMKSKESRSVVLNK